MCLCLGFDQRVVVDVCRGDDFFFNGFAPAMIFFNGFFFFLNEFAPVMIFLIGDLDFKSAVWVSDQ